MCECVFLTVGLGQVLVQLLPVVLVQDGVDAGVDQLLLLVLQVLRHIVRHEDDASLPVHHEQEAVQSLRAQPQQVSTGHRTPACRSVQAPRGLTCSRRGPRWSLSMTPCPVEDTSDFWTSSSLDEAFPAVKKREQI